MLELARGAQAAIEASRGRIDDLNVYPVPDGDTGTNLALTVRAAVGLERVDDCTHGQREIRSRVAVGHRVDIEVVDPAARRLDCCLRAPRKLQHTLSQETLTSSTTTSTASTGSPVSRSTS